MRMTYYDPEDPIGRRPPWWLDQSLEPCKCFTLHSVAPKLLYEADGYSDAGFYRWQCPECGTQWCTYLEG